MKRFYGAIIIILLLVIIAGAYNFIIKGSTVEGQDGRTVILLDSGERNHILKEMRGLLGYMQQLIDAISNDDMDKVANVAQILVDDSSGTTPTSIIAKMPIAFKKISYNIHGDFKDLLEATRKNKDSKEALKQVSKIMRNCLACHASYTLVPKVRTHQLLDAVK